MNLPTAVDSDSNEADVRNLLVYLPKYCVLICTKCQFAIQPGALSSHLLRHKIYRHNRQQLLQRFSHVCLKSPADVSLPRQSEPLVHLAVYDGLRCEAEGCDHLCVTLKRMELHWAEKHGVHNRHHVLASKVKLQTFFKGTALRYFQVRDSGGVDDDDSAETSPPERSVNMGPPGDGDGVVENDETPHLDVDSLRYLHHFTMQTATTLPKRHESVSFWQQEVPELGLRFHFLLYGLLGVSAFHLAVQEPERVTEHQEKAMAYFAAGLPAYRDHLTRASTENSTALIIFGRFLYIQHHLLMFSVRASPLYIPDDTNALEYLNRAGVIYGSTELPTLLYDIVPPESGIRCHIRAFKEMVEEGKRQLAHGLWRDSFEQMPRRVYDRLRALPGVILDAVGYDPGVTADVEMWRPAHEALLLSFAWSYNTPDDERMALFEALDCLTRLMERPFLDALYAGRSVPLVLLAHYMVLVLRQSRHVWYFKGVAERQIILIRCLVREEFRPIIDVAYDLV